MTSKKTGYEFWQDVLCNPCYVVAPMVDMSELPFRELCRQYGAQLCFTPMLHSQQFVQDILYRNDCFSTTSTDRPLIVQFCANDPNVFVNAANLVCHQCDAVDLNLGCPQAIAKKGHYGAFLQDEWDLIRSIIRKASSELPVPVTCKMRVMPGPALRSVEYAKMLEDAGCSVITVHGRTIFQKGHNTGLASWDVIKNIKENIKIPVIANGNILTYEDVQSCLEYTKADAVMSAEALLHNPALFSGKNPPVWKMANEYLVLAQKYDTPLRHVRNHMYRVLYLCLHQDSQLRILLENAGSYEDFHQICEYVKTLPLKLIEQHKTEVNISELLNCLSLSEKTCGDLSISNVVSSFPHLSHGENMGYKCCDSNLPINPEDLTNHPNLPDSASQFHSVKKSSISDEFFHELIVGENIFTSDEEEETLENTSSKYCPVWVCHSRPRIVLNGENRGCYSKYFESNEMSVPRIAENDQDFLSKRQQRRVRHYARVLAAMKENRKAKKMRRKQKLLDLKESNNTEMKVKTGDRVTKKQQKMAIRQRLLEAQNNAPKVCIDLGYSSEMSNKELHKLSSQLRRLYGSNRHSEKPFHLYFCNFPSTDPLYEICASKNNGFTSYVVDMVAESPEELFQSERLIYLSPDSENILSQMDSNKVYVIGGIVDGSGRKGLSLGRAKHLELASARLPILEYMERVGQSSGKTVLSVNQVFDILLKYYETDDWVQALSVGVPSRKGFKIREQTVVTEPESSTESNSRDVLSELANGE